IEAGKMTVERMATNPRRIVADVVSLMAPRANKKHLALEVRYDGPVPMHIQSNPTRLRQVLMNLIANAIKFTEFGGVTIRMRTVNERDASRLDFAVIDTGIGIDAKHLGRLLAPFSQADASTSRKYGGTGLGLAISMRLVGMLGGDLTISSAP